MRTRLADDADEFRMDLGSGAVVDPSRSEGTTMSKMTSVWTNGVELGVETFGRDADPLVLLAGGTTMLSWPDSVCERLAAGGRWVVRYDLRDCGASTALDPEAPAYRLRISPPMRRRLSARSVPRRLTSAASGSAGWSLRQPRSTTRR